MDTFALKYPVAVQIEPGLEADAAIGTIRASRFSVLPHQRVLASRPLRSRDTLRRSAGCAGPFAPCGPAAPVAPVAPCGPGIPCGPATPVAPCGPAAPVAAVRAGWTRNPLRSLRPGAAPLHTTVVDVTSEGSSLPLPF